MPSLANHSHIEEPTAKHHCTAAFPHVLKKALFQQLSVRLPYNF